MKKYLIYIISVLLLVFSVNSILGPESSELTANSLTIIHPLYEIYQKNSNITFNFDVLNRMASLYNLTKNYDIAMLYANKAMKINSKTKYRVRNWSAYN